MSAEGGTPEIYAEADACGALFTAPAGLPFLDALATAILNGNLPRIGGPATALFDLPQITILLPTRRAARSLQHAFLAASGQRALLLPRIRPIAEAEEDLTLLSGLTATPTATPGSLIIPPAISELERRLVLTELVLRWSTAMREGSEFEPYAAAGASTPAQAANLAKELGRLVDMVETEGGDLSGLAELVPETFSEHWQKTLQFLQIVLQWWPAHLDERNLVSPMDRRNRLILAEAERLTRDPPSTPVIVAGVTGSIPATAELMRAVVGLPQGAIVLPGLDQDLDAESWASLPSHPEHPQFGLAKLLSRLQVDRLAVRSLPAQDTAQQASADLRARLISEALRPAATSHLWRGFIASANRAAVRDAMQGISCIEAPNSQDEAETVALILREALEVPGQTAALVSPDRVLARRVAVRLESWGIRVDDSAGRPFGKTVPGAFLDLVIDAISQDFVPAALMALLRHPLTRLGLGAGVIRRTARNLEIIAFRTEYLGRGLDGVAAAIENAQHRKDEKTRRQRALLRLWDEDWDAARDLVVRLVAAFEPLAACFANPDAVPLGDLVKAHVATAEALATLPPNPDATAETEESSPLWQGEAGEAASLLLAGLLDPNLSAPALTAVDYPDFYRSLVASENVRPHLPAHPRLSIWGPFEARLQQPDIVILGSLNEGTWPETTDAGPWLNRPMRDALSLPQPEERIGYAAHDFAQLMSARTVYLTRAQKSDGAPTVASRWLLRLKALLDGMEIGDVLASPRPWLTWARERDAIPQTRARITAPMPRPALELRPRRMSVSDVERWIGNPYAVFAKHVLGLEQLPELGAEPGPALRGAIIHEALSRFARMHGGPLPENAAGHLMEIARAILVEYTGNPRIAAFWVPRLERFAHWFGDTEAGRREGVTRILSEVSGTEVLEAPGGPFRLTARADRIDVREDGVVITDYKTGSASAIASLAGRAAKGTAPQLPLEAVIALAGGFDKLGASGIAGLRYISASGGEPPGVAVDIKSGDLSALAAEVRTGLERLIALYDVPDTPYRALRRAGYDYRYDEFEHLARVKEWQSGDAEGGSDE